MKNFTDYAANFLFSAMGVLMVLFIAVIIKLVLEETEIERITLDSGKQCVVTVKGNRITNLDCE